MDTTFEVDDQREVDESREADEQREADTISESCSMCNTAADVYSFTCDYCKSKLCLSCIVDLGNGDQNDSIEVCIMCGEETNIESNFTLFEMLTAMSSSDEIEEETLCTIDSHPYDWLKQVTNIPIQNIGNTCYINAALQLILHTNLFHDLLESFDMPKKAIMRKFIKVLRSSYTELQNIKETEQCDSTLFFKYLLDLMRDRNMPEIDEILSRISTMTQCNSCSTKSNTRQYDTMLTVYIPEQDMELIDAYKASVLRNTLSKKCESCAETTDHIQKSTVKMNTWLFLHLVYQPQAYVKRIYATITFGSKSPQKYELKAFIVHRRQPFSNENSGHYVAYCKEENDEWIEYDDEKVTVTSEDTILALLTNMRTSQYYLTKCVCLAYSKISSDEQSEEA